MYTLTEFDGLALPLGTPRYTAGTAGTQERTVRTVGGGLFDGWGAAQARMELPYRLAYDCRAYASTAAALRATLDALRAKRGVRGRLVRQGDNDDGEQWATARLMEVEYQADVMNLQLIQPLRMAWSVQSPWYGGSHGTGWTLASGLYLDAGLYLDMASRHVLTATSNVVTVTNYGNAAVENAVLSVTAGMYNLTALTIRCGSCELVYSGTVVARKTLVIDCGAKTVVNDGTADYARLTLGANHASAAWMRLAPGANSVTVTRTGGGAETAITFEFSDAWE